MTNEFRLAIQTYMTSEGLNIAKASKLFDMPRDTFSKFINAKTESIKLDTFMKIAKIIDYNLPTK